MAASEVPALALSSIATILLLLVCVSSPILEGVYFMEARSEMLNTTSIRFGTFGFSHSTRLGVGYQGLDLTPLGIRRANESEARETTDCLETLSKALVLHPIATGFGGLTILFAFCDIEVGVDSGLTHLVPIFLGFATLFALVAWIIDMVLFAVVAKQLNDLGIRTAWGNATWLVLTAVVVLVVGFVIVAADHGMCVGPRRKGYAYLAQFKRAFT
ncbi:hypothetical protein PQX77_017125 [Marasmius sp. AFHP31]|nr:hypothetical protein PQX77_017125 [Marasmius sp. AFHP31]